MPTDIRWIDDGGRWWRGCSCLAEWWPAYRAAAAAEGHHVSITQGCYSADAVAASATTHNGGGVLDIVATNYRKADDLAEVGGAASFERDPRDKMPWHIHLVLIGCPHLDPAAARQVTSWQKLRNGLAGQGLDRDQTRPTPGRTWATGLTYLTDKDDDMAMSDADRAALIDDIAAAAAARVFAHPIGREQTTTSTGKVVPLTFASWCQTVLYGVKPGTSRSLLGKIANKLGVTP